MDIVDTLRFISGTLMTTMALGAGIWVVWAVSLGLSNDKIARRGYAGTAFGFALGVFIVVPVLVAGLID
jgi:hypothetical protein